MLPQLFISPILLALICEIALFWLELCSHCYKSLVEEIVLRGPHYVLTKACSFFCVQSEPSCSCNISLHVWSSLPRAAVNLGGSYTVTVGSMVGTCAEYPHDCEISTCGQKTWRAICRDLATGGIIQRKNEDSVGRYDYKRQSYGWVILCGSLWKMNNEPKRAKRVSSYTKLK